MEKLVILDVGSHEAQEFKSIFKNRFWDYFYHWLKHLNRIRRVGGEACSVTSFRALLANAAWLKSKRNSVFYILVEPNKRLCALPIYRDANMVANLALSKEQDIVSVRRLYFSNNQKLGQGSSLFKEKPNIDLNDFDWILSLDPKYFFARILSDTFVNDETNFLLRLNNEGAEVEVIEAAHEVFGDRLLGLLGSLSDVEKVKGTEAMLQLNKFISENELTFIPFHSDFATWPNAMAFIRTAVEK